MSTSKLNPSYFHEDLRFDYEKFFYGILSFSDPIFYGYKLKFTTTFIYKDAETGKPFARYKLLDEFEDLENFSDEKAYLENYKIFLDAEANKEFSISQVFHDFHNLKLDFANNQALRKQSLERYFGEEGDQIPGPEEDVSHYPQDVEHLLKVEAIYVKLLLTDFDPDSSFYLPLPIIAFGNLVGMIYFLYDEDSLKPHLQDDQEALASQSFQNHYRSLILQATREYERIILENRIKTFYLKPEDPLEDYKEIFKDLEIPYDFYYPFRWEDKSQPIIKESSFLRELGYDNYYQHLSHVVIKEAKQLQGKKLEQVKTAIIAIVVDSFAHNVGAHSLVALKWWFEVRYSAAAQQLPLHPNLETQINTQQIHEKIRGTMDEKINFHSRMDDFDHNSYPDQIALLNIVRFMDKEDEKNLLKYVGKTEGAQPDLIAQFPVPVAQSIYHFFQYLRDKSAFWSGVTRDTLFSGRIRSWDKILRDFLNNTLFLGTIAHSEGINKVRLYVEILEPSTHPEQTHPKVLLGGEYAQVNLEIIKKESGRYEKEEPKSKDNQGYSDYAFLRKGENFDEIHKYLKEEMVPVYLPNGIIGQHALYTILENTLRNIKHYKELLNDLKDEGVILYLSIQEVPFLQRMDDDLEAFEKDYESIPKYKWTSHHPLYKIGVWLHHPQKLINPSGAFVNEDYVVDENGKNQSSKFSDYGTVIGAQTQRLRRRVVNEKGNSVLGGSSQDKVCASMLINNRFQHVDDIDLEKVKRQYFPYVMVASEMYTPVEARGKGFVVEDDILHKAYNTALASRTPDERMKRYKSYIRQYGKKISQKKAQLKEVGHGASHEVEAQGTIKKYFHLWKGEKALVVDKDFMYKHENLSRFRVLAIHNYERDGKKLPFRVSGGLKEKKQSAEYDFRAIGLIRLVEAESDWNKLGEGSIEGQNQELYEKAMLKWMETWLGNTEKRKGVVIFKEAQDSLMPVWALYLRGGQIETVPYDELEEDEVYTALGIEPNQSDVGISTSKLLEADHACIQPIIVQHSATTKAPNPYAFKIRSHTSFFTYIFEGYERGSGNEGYSHENFMNARRWKQIDSPIKLLETVLTHITFFDSRIYERFHAIGGHAEQMAPNEFWNQLRIQAHPEDPGLFRSLRDLDKQNQILSKQHHFIVIHLSFIETIYRSRKYQDGNGERDKYKESDVLEFFTEEIVAFAENELPSNIILVITSGRGRGEWFQGTEHPQITFRPIEALLSAIEDGISLKDDFQIKYNLCNVLFGS
ncbi:MAG: hypothetical protein AAFW00_21170 [Bacteroidota bacterium]